MGEIPRATVHTDKIVARAQDKEKLEQVYLADERIHRERKLCTDTLKILFVLIPAHKDKAQAAELVRPAEQGDPSAGAPMLHRPARPGVDGDLCIGRLERIELLHARVLVGSEIEYLVKRHVLRRAAEHLKVKLAPLLRHAALEQAPPEMERVADVLPEAGVYLARRDSADAAIHVDADAHDENPVVCAERVFDAVFFVEGAAVERTRCVDIPHAAHALRERRKRRRHHEVHRVLVMPHDEIAYRRQRSGEFSDEAGVDYEEAAGCLPRLRTKEIVKRQRTKKRYFLVEIEIFPINPAGVHAVCRESRITVY